MAENKNRREVKKRLSLAEKLAYQNCVQHIYDWMGYQNNAILPKFVYGLLGTWHKEHNYSYEVILETMFLVDNTVQHCIDTMNFNNDGGKLKYICSIIRNNLNDGLKQFARKQKEIQATRQAEINVDNFPSEEELLNIGVKNANKDVKNVQKVISEVTNNG